MSYNLTGATVSTTYGRIVQVVLGSPNTYYDGFGTLLSDLPGQGPTGPTGPQGQSLNWTGSWDDSFLYSYYDLVNYGNDVYICIDSLDPGPTYSSPDLDPVHWELMIHAGYHSTTGVTAASYSIFLNDNPTQYFGVSHSTSPATITLPDYTFDGKVVIIKDESGNAKKYNITINASKIDQSNQAVIALDNGSLTMMWRVDTWWII
jgi:hypothetical protein